MKEKTKFRKYKISKKKKQKNIPQKKVDYDLKENIKNLKK